MGEQCWFIGTDVETFGSEPFLISIGNHVLTTAGVRFLTHDGGVFVFWGKDPTLDVVAPIHIGNNVFIGMNSIILPGVTIGDNVIVGAGSVVGQNIASGQVVAGVPARVIKTTSQYLEGIQDRSIRLNSGLSPAERQKISWLIISEDFRHPRNTSRSRVL